MREVTVKDEGFGVWSTTIVKDDVIAHKRSQHVKGVNRHSGKSYSRFSEQESTFFSWKRNDRLRIYRSVGPHRGRGRSFQDITHTVVHDPKWYTRDVEVVNGFRLLKGEDPAQVIQAEYPLSRNCTPIPGLTAHLRHSDAFTFTRSLFGDRVTRKDLVRSVGGVLEYSGNDATSAAISLGKSVAGLVPTDWVVEWIPRVGRECVQAAEFPHHINLRRMLKTASDKQLRRLITTDGTAYGLRDSLRSFQLIRDQKPGYLLADINFTSFKELHDVLARDQRKMKDPEKPIKYTGKAAKLPGDYGGYRIVAPKTTYDLVDWGNEMVNCIGGYGYQAVNGSTLLYAVYKGKDLIGNMEIAPGTGNIRQLLGKYNFGISDHKAVEAVHNAVLSVYPEAVVNGGWQGAAF